MACSTKIIVTSDGNQESRHCEAKQSKIFIVLPKKKRKRHKIYHFGDTSGEPVILTSSSCLQKISTTSSSPEFKKHRSKQVKTSRSSIKQNEIKQPRNFRLTESRLTGNTNPFVSFRQPVMWRVYRCQLNTTDKTCCCSCNSDAMFEVMKSLYDCYKKKNCDHCNCILCGHLPHEERKFGEIRKTTGGLESASIKEKKDRLKSILSEIVGISSADRVKVLKEMALKGVPLPDGKTASEQKLIKKVRRDIGLPPKPTTDADKQKYNDAILSGLIGPLEAKSPEEKEKILRAEIDLGLRLPEGRTTSEKALINKVKAMLKSKEARTSDKVEKGTTTPTIKAKILSEKLRKAKAEGLLTHITGKPPEQIEEIIKCLAKLGIPLPEGKTSSEKKMINKIQKDMGLPPAPTTIAMRKKYDKAYADGIITPLKGKTQAQKEKILKGLTQAGVPLPEGRTSSEKALVKKVTDESGPAPLALKTSARKAIRVVKIPSEKLRKAKAEGLVTPLAGKTPEQKEKILKGLTRLGIPLPEAKTALDKKLIDKVRKDVGLPPAPTTSAMKTKYDKAYADGIITPLEGKTPAQQEIFLKGLAQAGIPLPEGRTLSEKVLVKKARDKTGPVTCECPKPPTAEEKPTLSAKAAKMYSEKLRKAKAEGLLTPITGKTADQKEEILKGLTRLGIPLPEGKTSSEKKLIDKFRKDLGLPPTPTTSAMKTKYDKAYADGIITPLEGKTPVQKEKILKRLAQGGLPLPEGRTPSEKGLVKKVMAESGAVAPAVKISSEKLRKAKSEGLILITPLTDKTPEQKEKILKGLTRLGIPLPEAKTALDKKLIDKVRKDVGLPPAPTTSAMKTKYDKAYADGIITPLEGKTPAQQEKILKGLAQAGIPLPEGRTLSEKVLVKKARDKTGPVTCECPKPPTAEEKPTLSAKAAKMYSEKLRKAKAEGLLTPITGKTADQKEKILKGLTRLGIPLPEGKTSSEKKLIDKFRKDVGLPPTPTTSAIKTKYDKAYADGIITPLEGKTPVQKEKILKRLAQGGLPLPEGRTPSEKALVKKVKTESGYVTPHTATTTEKKDETGPIPLAAKPSAKAAIISSEKLRKAKAAGLITPLTGKTPDYQEKILKGLAQHGIPLPEGKTSSEKKLIDKFRKDVGLPPTPTTSAMKTKYDKAYAYGIITPLEGKTPVQKEKILKRLAQRGLPLPEGRTPSEKALVKKLKAETSSITPAVQPSAKAVKPPTAIREIKIPSEKLRQAKAEGLITPLTGKTAEQKEKILKGLTRLGIPLPEGKTSSEKKLIDKVRKDVGLPPTPTTSAMKTKYEKAYADGIITPLEGKTPAQQEKMLKGLTQAGIPLPEGRTPSEKVLVKKARDKTGPVTCECPKPPTAVEKPTLSAKAAKIHSEKLRKAKAEGLLTPITGKTSNQKEKILKGLTRLGIPLPEGKTSSEKKLIDKFRKDVGLPPTPTTSAMKTKYDKAYAYGIITPLEGKTPVQKEKILKRLAQRGLPLPEGRTPSEKALVKKLKAETSSITPAVQPSAKAVKPPTAIREIKIPSEKLRKAKAEGLITPLTGKTAEQKEKILKGLTRLGIPLPEGKTSSEKKLIDKVRKDVGLPPTPTTSAMKTKYEKAYADGIITPLEGKTPAQQEKMLKELTQAGIPLPEGRTPSEKVLVKKARDETGPVTCECPKPPTAAAKPTLSAKAAKIHSEKLRKAKAEGLLTPIAGKTPKEKEKILKGLAKHGISLPEIKTALESSKYDRAKVSGDPGLLTHLQGKTSQQKEKNILREAAKKKKKDTVLKTSKQKEKILRDLAMRGLPFPVAKTDSDRKLIDKVRADLGMPPEPKTNTEQKNYSEALAKGHVIPLEGKSQSEKENILTTLQNLGVQLPVGRTTSEKELIDKIKAGRHVATSKKDGIGDALQKRSRGMAAEGVTDEFEEVKKTTTCERACGCDKKKIKFKHSYIKIKVTSPDISSLCPCPVECITGEKGGVFIDSEGIKITVGSAIGFPSFFEQNLNNTSKRSTSCFNLNRNIHSYQCNIDFNTKQSKPKSSRNDKHAETKQSNKKNRIKLEKDKLVSKITNLNNYIESSESTNINDQGIVNEIYENKTKFKLKNIEIITSSSFISLTPEICDITSESNEGSAISILRPESSLCYSSTSSNNVGTISIISLHSSNIIPTSSHYVCYPDSLSSGLDEDDSEYLTNQVDYIAEDKNQCLYDTELDPRSTIVDQKHVERRTYIKDLFDFKVTQHNIPYQDKVKVVRNEHKPIIIINDLNRKSCDVLRIVENIISQRDDSISTTSSLLVMVPTTDDEDDESDNVAESASSTICLQLSEHFFWGNNVPQNVQYHPASVVPGIYFKHQGKCAVFQDLHSESSYSITVDSHKSKTTANGNKALSAIPRHRITAETTDTVKNGKAQFSMDTTQDRPCCCKSETICNIFSEVLNPMMLNQGLNPTQRRNSKENNLNGQPSAIYKYHTSTKTIHCSTLNFEMTGTKTSCPDNVSKNLVKFAVKSKLQNSTRSQPQPLECTPKMDDDKKLCKGYSENESKTKIPCPFPKPVYVKSTGCGPTTCEHLMPPPPPPPVKSELQNSTRSQPQPLECTPKMDDDKKLCKGCSENESKTKIPCPFPKPVYVKSTGCGPTTCEHLMPPPPPPPVKSELQNSTRSQPQPLECTPKMDDDKKLCKGCSENESKTKIPCPFPKPVYVKSTGCGPTTCEHLMPPPPPPPVKSELQNSTRSQPQPLECTPKMDDDKTLCKGYSENESKTKIPCPFPKPVYVKSTGCGPTTCKQLMPPPPPPPVKLPIIRFISNI